MAEGVAGYGREWLVLISKDVNKGILLLVSRIAYPYY